MMSPTKASKLLTDYSKNNFNAYKTLIENGYSEKTAKAVAKRTLNTAHNVVNDKLQLSSNDVKETAQSVFDIVGMSKQDVIKELVKVLQQDRDFTNKLRAMSPLLKALNYNLDDSETNTAPQLNITVREKPPQIRETEAI
jgi:hypothetical protein